MRLLGRSGRLLRQAQNYHFFTSLLNTYKKDAQVIPDNSEKKICIFLLLDLAVPVRLIRRFTQGEPIFSEPAEFQN